MSALGVKDHIRNVLTGLSKSVDLLDNSNNMNSFSPEKSNVCETQRHVMGITNVKAYAMGTCKNFITEVIICVLLTT